MCILDGLVEDVLHIHHRHLEIVVVFEQLSCCIVDVVLLLVHNRHIVVVVEVLVEVYVVLVVAWVENSKWKINCQLNLK